VRAVVVEAHGGLEVLQVREVPDPEPGPGELLVAVAADTAASTRQDRQRRRTAL